jgi:anti-sigma regulatory factor (Ser/Thr protein kinase)
VTTKLVVPGDRKLRYLFVNANWAHLIDPATHGPSNAGVAGNLPAHEFTSPDEQFSLVNQLIDAALGMINFLDRDALRAFEWALQEITDNVLQHSGSDAGGLAQLSIHRQSREIEFTVADAGVGIPASLRTAFPNLIDDVSTLQEAVKEGVTRGTGQGNGLYGSSQMAVLSGGPFYLNSGGAYLAIDRQGRSSCRHEPDSLVGTSVTIFLNYDKPLLLENSLRIGGRPFTTTDLVEMRYEDTESGAIRIVLRNEVSSIGSRHSGGELRNKLVNVHNLTGGTPIRIDCSEIGIMSSSFADEAFAKLMMKYGRSYFKENFLLEKISHVNMQIIERSWGQRERSESSDTLL